MFSFLPSWLNWYKKPSYVDLKVFAASLNTRVEEKYTDRSSSRNSYSSLKTEESIPKDLSLERVLASKTCSPMSLHDFYMYLKHIEYSQENLEFYLWFKDYEKRYAEEEAKSAAATAARKEMMVGVVPLPEVDVNSSLSSDTFDSDDEKASTPRESRISPGFIAYIEALVLHEAARYPRPCCTTFLATAQACKPETPREQHHEELQNIIALFLTPGAPKELNIPPSMRNAAMKNLMDSNSPTHLAKIAEHVYALIRYGSHRNFVRLGVNNGTFETLCMVTFVGITMTAAGFFTMLLIAFASPGIHRSSLWRGLATIPFWFVGLSFLLAGMRGSCFLLLLFSRRQELPWERVDDRQSLVVDNTHTPKGVSRFTKKLMIFERKIRVRDMGLRRLQRKIVIQSVVGAVIGTAALEVFFLVLPIWR